MKPFAVKLEFRDGPAHVAIRWEEFETLREAKDRAKEFIGRHDVEFTIYAAL